MKRLLILLLFVQCQLSIVHCQLLYEISGNGAKGKSYLLATNKLADITFLDSIPHVFEAWGKTKKVITEFALEDYEALAALRQAAVLPDSLKLAAYYTSSEYEAINEALRLTLDMGLDKLCRMKPSYLTELYRTELLVTWLKYDEKRSLETFFEQIAQEKGIPVVGLDELGEALFMLFDREPFHFQCEELKNIIEYPEREVKLERAIYDMYKARHLNDIAYQISAPDNLSTLSFSDYQIYCQRNLSWAKRLKAHLEAGPCFITLNANYLGGEKGLIAVLRKEGYRVKGIK